MLLAGSAYRLLLLGPLLVPTYTEKAEMMQKCTMHIAIHASNPCRWVGMSRGRGGCRTQSQATPGVVKKKDSKNNYSQGWGQVPTAPEKIYCGAPLLSYLLRGSYMLVRVGVGVVV